MQGPMGGARIACALSCLARARRGCGARGKTAPPRDPGFHARPLSRHCPRAGGIS